MISRIDVPIYTADEALALQMPSRPPVANTNGSHAPSTSGAGSISLPDGSCIVRRKVDDDNSCLFSAVAYVMQGSRANAAQLRYSSSQLNKLKLDLNKLGHNKLEVHEPASRQTDSVLSSLGPFGLASCMHMSHV